MAIRPRQGIILAALVTLVVAGVAGTIFLRPPVVPLETRVRETAAPTSAQPGFRDMAREAGFEFQMQFLPDEQGADFKINLYDHGSGVAVADYDGDGHEDIYFLNQLGPNALFKNRGDGTFSETTAEAGVALEDRICVAAGFADYDNDGDQDLFVTSTRGGNVLFRNTGKGTFEDITETARVAYVGHSQSPLFFDFDNDGWLDLFVANTAEWTTDELDENKRHFIGKPNIADLSVNSRKEDNLLYRNNGDGTFTEMGIKAGLGGLGWSNDACLVDYDEDGNQDLLVTNMFGPSQLYRNDGKGKFINVTAKTLGRTPFGGMGAKAFDYNNDGRLDILIVDMHSDMWVGLDFDHRTEQVAKQVEKQKLGPEMWVGVSHLPPTDPMRQELVQRFARDRGIDLDELVFGNVFLKNLGGGRFDEVSKVAGLESFWPWGVATGDFDNDGYEDAFLASGMGFPFYYWPNQLMMNTGKESFIDCSTERGIEPPVRGKEFGEPMRGVRSVRSSRCAAVADFDQDGRLEIVTNNFNHEAYFFKNEFPQQNFIAFELTGTKSNRDAIGAVARLHAGREVLTRQVTSGCGYISQSSKRLHFGLGSRAEVDRVEIVWPSGHRVEIMKPEINRNYRVTEASPEE